MLTYPLEKRGKTPLYECLYRHIRDDILSGALRAGERLPSRRALAEHLRLSVVTVETAYRQLEAEGYVSVQARRGVFVNETNRPPTPPGAIPEAVAPDAAPRVWKLDLTDNSPDASLIPAAALARLTRQALSENLEALFVPPPGPGLPILREAIAHDLYEYRGMTVSPEQILVGAGAEYLYLLLPQLLGNSALFALEDPGYLKIRHAYSNSGTRFVCLPLDSQGLNMDALRHSGANVAHISPAHHYPTGLVTPIGRRHALLRWAEESGGWLVEDDYDSELRFTGRPIPTLQSIDHRGRVLYMNTFSQTISPSLRVGYLVLPPPLLEVYRRKLSFYACTVPTLEQYVLARFLESGQYEQHLSRLRKVYRARRAAVLDAFRENFAGRVTISEQGAGLHFLLRPRADGIRQRAERAGVRLRFLSDYAAAPTPEQRNTVVVHYAALPPERLAEAIALLNEIFC